MQLKITKQLKRIIAVLALVFLTTASAQVEVSVPFNEGFISRQKTNLNYGPEIKLFTNPQMLIEKMYFVQYTTSGLFEIPSTYQGNDIPGTIRIQFQNDIQVELTGAINWKAKEGGQTKILGFVPDNTTRVDLKTYNGTVSPSYFIDGGKAESYLLDSEPGGVYTANIGVQYIGQTHSNLLEGDDVSGSADKPTISDLNAYLNYINSNKPDGPVTVSLLSTCDSTPTLSGTVSMSIADGDSLEVVFDGMVYKYSNTNSSTSDITYNALAQTWSLPITSGLSTGTYSVDASIINSGGYVLTDSTFDEITILENILPTISNQSFSYDENRVSGAVVGTVTVTSGTSLTYSIISGDTTYYSIDSSTGAIALTSIGASSIANDFESTPNAFSVVVQVANTCNSTATATITLNVNDIDETETTPPTVNDQSFTYAEN